VKLTKRGRIVVSIAATFGIISLFAISGAIETQDIPTCDDFVVSQDWQGAMNNNCPFVNDNGEYLYTWEPR